MKKFNNKNRCVVYARYSCSNQSEQSIEGQMHDCEKYAEQNGLHIIGTYIDRALTATSDKRPQFQQMIKDSAKQTFDVVLVWKLDRFSRNRYDSAVYKSKLKKNGVRVVSVTENISDNPEGILMESILEGYAEYYSVELGQKVKRGMRETAAKGKITCAIPFGYRKSAIGTYEIDPLTAPAVKKVFEMYSNRERNTDIVAWLNNHGYRTTKGNLFKCTNIYTIVRRERYCGRYTYDGVEYTDETQRIVSDELFQKAQLIVKINKKSGAVYKAHETYLLSCKLFCGYCHKPIYAESAVGRNGNVYCYYRCANSGKRNNCVKKRIPKDYIENTIVSHILENALNPDVVKRIADAIILMQDSAPEPDSLLALKAKKSDIEKRITNLMNAIEQGIITDTTKNRLAELESAHDAVTVEIQQYSFNSHKITRNEIYRYFESVAASDFSTMEDKAKLINLFVNRIYVWDDQSVILYNFTNTPNNGNDSDYDKIIKELSGKFSDSSCLGSPNILISEQLFCFESIICQIIKL